jgi:hypothetical protein
MIQSNVKSVAAAVTVRGEGSGDGFHGGETPGGAKRPARSRLATVIASILLVAAVMSVTPSTVRANGPYWSPWSPAATWDPFYATPGLYNPYVSPWTYNPYVSPWTYSPYATPYYVPQVPVPGWIGGPLSPDTLWLNYGRLP